MTLSIRYCPICGGTELDVSAHGSPGTVACRSCKTVFTVLGVPTGASAAPGPVPVPPGGRRDPAFFEQIYAAGTPPWDIGRPQPFVLALLAAGRIRGRVLDAGCGTGENALAVGAQGLDAVGIDASSRAIEQARAKASARGLARVRFEVGDALALDARGETFDVALDSGLFHVFADPERPRYARSLRAALRPGGLAFIACFSEREPNWGGPRRVTQDELRATFREGWQIESIDATEFDTNLPTGRAQAWLATFSRTA